MNAQNTVSDSNSSELYLKVISPPVLQLSVDLLSLSEFSLHRELHRPR